MGVFPYGAEPYGRDALLSCFASGMVRPGRPCPGVRHNVVHPCRGFRSGTARTVHFFFPHFEHRKRFATSSSRVSHPHNRPKVCEVVTRSYPHAEHVRISVYCPNSSLNFSTWNGGMPPIVPMQSARVHPVLDTREHCIKNGSRLVTSRHRLKPQAPRLLEAAR